MSARDGGPEAGWRRLVRAERYICCGAGVVAEMERIGNETVDTCSRCAGLCMEIIGGGVSMLGASNM